MYFLFSMNVTSPTPAESKGATSSIIGYEYCFLIKTAPVISTTSDMLKASDRSKKRRSAIKLTFYYFYYFFCAKITSTTGSLLLSRFKTSFEISNFFTAITIALRNNTTPAPVSFATSAIISNNSFLTLSIA